jgi:hypothetical protein
MVFAPQSPPELHFHKRRRGASLCYHSRERDTSCTVVAPFLLWRHRIREWMSPVRTALALNPDC